MKPETKKAEEKMQKALAALNSNFNTIRAGRANPAVLDRITVEYYGTPTPLNQMAAISVPDPRTLMISPWDRSTLKSIEKAIQTSDLGINPNNDGSVIRLVFPPMTSERRSELAKEVHKMAEDGKIALRNIRRDAMDKLKAQKKNGEITEDDVKDGEKEIQKVTDKYVKEADAMADKKIKEIQEI
ncbi:MAG TPA: ribosome recycling factor [Candidatus Faecivivens stercoravium]|uniref:Ribosome-recycling factor n=2 Tax=Candidatus Faecivivens stercoravium TaxID=2840803 RepID=A0A9D1J5H1_9FIRM|nr:ribosome recycling factor [Candidatus Faecivivens stercoravium]